MTICVDSGGYKTEVLAKNGFTSSGDYRSKDGFRRIKSLSLNYFEDENN